MNKKATTQIAIVLITLMTLILCGAALFSFLTGKSLDKKMTDAKFIENVYLREEQISLFVYEVARDALKKSAPFNIDKFKTDFKAEINQYGTKLIKPEDSFYKDTKETYKYIYQVRAIVDADDKNTYLVEQKGDYINIIFKNFEIDEAISVNLKNETITVQYIHDINVQVPLKDV